MVRRRINGTHPVCTRGETVSDVGRNDSLPVSFRVDTLEVRKLLWIRRLNLTQVGQLLNDKVSVSNDHSLAIELLRGGEVVLLCVDKVSGVEVLHSHIDGELLVGGDGSTVGGIRELGRGHPVDAWDEANGRWVA